MEGKLIRAEAAVEAMQKENDVLRMRMAEIVNSHQSATIGSARAEEQLRESREEARLYRAQLELVQQKAVTSEVALQVGDCTAP